MKVSSMLMRAGFLVVFPWQVYADGQRTVDEFGIPPAVQDQQRAQPAGSNPGADASFDKRLPPVFPGEEVNDGQKKIKVWSSSGPVPVAEAPEPWNKNAAPNPAHVAPGSVGVIIDRRREERLADEYDKQHGSRE